MSMCSFIPQFFKKLSSFKGLVENMAWSQKAENSKSAIDSLGECENTIPLSLSFLILAFILPP